MRWYRSREGEVAAIDTPTTLATLGSDGTKSTIKVPAKAAYLEKVIVAGSPNFASAASGFPVIKLSGGGLRDGPENVVAPGGGTSVATGNIECSPARVIKLMAAVIPGQLIEIAMDHAGVDVGELSAGATLVFWDGR